MSNVILDDIKCVQFVAPVPQRKYMGLNPGVAGFKTKAVLFGWVFSLICIVILIMGTALLAMKGLPEAMIGILLVIASGLLVAAARWFWKRTNWCEICGACVGFPFCRSTVAWCPSCQNLIAPERVLVDHSKKLDLTSPEYLYHRDPVPRFVAMTLLLAICDKACQLRFEPGIDIYNVTVIRSGRSHEVAPPRYSFIFRSNSL